MQKKIRILNSWFAGGTRQRMATFWASNLEECSALHAVHQGALQAGRTDCQRSRQGNISICKCVDSALNPDYETVNGPDLVTLSPDVVKDLIVTWPKIWLQNNQGSYKRCFAYGNGKLCNGLICHSRWLTTANRFLLLWVSQHWETGENLYRLREIIKFIVGVYYPMWVMIKTRRSRTQGPAVLQVCEENESKCPCPDLKIHKVQCLECPLRGNPAIPPCWL